MSFSMIHAACGIPRPSECPPHVRIVAGLLACALSVSARADDGLPPSETESPAGWTVSVGAALVRLPRFPGAREDVVRVFPFIDAAYEDKFVADPFAKGIGPNIHFGPNWTLRPAVGISIDERLAEDDPRLRGLRDVKAAPDARVFLEFEDGRWSASASVATRLAREYSRGSQAELSGAYAVFLGKQLVVSVGARGTWMDGRYARNFFGITPAQSSVTGLPVYEATSGARDANVFVQAVYAWTPRWSTFASLEEGWLLGAARDSPITQRSQRTVALLVTTYRFR